MDLVSISQGRRDPSIEVPYPASLPQSRFYEAVESNGYIVTQEVAIG